MSRTVMFTGQVVPNYTPASYPFMQLVALDDHEVLDVAKLHEVQGICETELRGKLVMGDRVVITGWQVLEDAPAHAKASTELHLNSIDAANLPPVDSPLLIEIVPGVLLRARRPTHVNDKHAELRFDLDAGGYAVGRFRWTHA